MYGVVSLLDEQHDKLVEALWAELAERFGLRGVSVTPFPHCSYQVAEQYAVSALEGILREVAARTAPFQAQTTGLGIFTGAQPVLYIPVVRSLELSLFHQALWQAISGIGAAINAYYHPDHWMPHITIGFPDLDRERLSGVISLLSERSFTWNLTINNLALISDTGAPQEPHLRFNFGA